jgi:hypothetical protein
MFAIGIFLFIIRKSLGILDISSLLACCFYYFVLTFIFQKNTFANITILDKIESEEKNNSLFQNSHKYMRSVVDDFDYAIQFICLNYARFFQDVVADLQQCKMGKKTLLYF